MQNKMLLSKIWHIHMMEYYVGIKITLQETFNRMEYFHHLLLNEKAYKTILEICSQFYFVSMNI